MAVTEGGSSSNAQSPPGAAASDLLPEGRQWSSLPGFLLLLHARAVSTTAAGLMRYICSTSSDTCNSNMCQQQQPEYGSTYVRLHSAYTSIHACYDVNTSDKAYVGPPTVTKRYPASFQNCMRRAKACGQPPMPFGVECISTTPASAATASVTVRHCLCAQHKRPRVLCKPHSSSSPSLRLHLTLFNSGCSSFLCMDTTQYTKSRPANIPAARWATRGWP